MLTPGEFIKSSFCSADQPSCVEVSLSQGTVHPKIHVRDAGRSAVAFTPQEWEAFIAGVKAGEFDIPA